MGAEWRQDGLQSEKIAVVMQQDYLSPEERSRSGIRDMYPYFRVVLIKRKQELFDRAKHRGNRPVLKTQGHLTNYADLATRETECTVYLRMRDRERILMKAIDQALARIEGGTFGVCVQCDEEIELERLKTQPVATHCLYCQTQHEVASGRLRRPVAQR
jgi:DnaK suppressor protein